MKILPKLSLMAYMMCVLPLHATEYFVDKNRPDDSGDGKSETTAFRTIKYAIGKANAGDTVTVLPGDYGDDQGTPDTRDGQQNRVVIGKNITLRSRDGAAATHIVGKWANTANNMGEDGVRCIDAYSACTIKGFTFRDGSSNYAGGGNDQSANRGGGIFANGDAVVFTDCVISNCVGTRGGGACKGTYIRCKFIGNFASNYGCALREGAAFNCLFTGNGPSKNPFGSTVGTIAYPHAIVNCTIVNNNDYGIHTMTANGPGPIVNSVILFNRAGAGYSLVSSSITNCVTDNATITSLGYDCIMAATPETELYNPAGCDYRLMPGSSGISHGSLSVARDWFGSYVDETDLAGDPCYNSDAGTMNVGAFQSPGPSGGAALSIAVDTTKGRFFVNGNPIYATQPYRTIEYPHALCVGFQNDGTNGIICYTRSDTFEVQWPTENDEVWMIMPKTGSVSTTLHTGKFKYVDIANAGDPLADGTQAHPYPNIIDATTNVTADTVIMVADGEYREGCKYAGGLTNRVCLGNSYWKRLRSENGASKTFIFGAPGSGTDGIGADATRCVYADGYALVQGFTLLDGHSNDGSDGDAMHGGGMYACLSPYAGTGTCHDQFIGIADCVISNCVASRGAAIFGGFAYRCLITGNRAVNNGITRNCVICASLVTRNEDVNNKGVIGTLSTLYQTTVGDNFTTGGAVSFQDSPAAWHTNAVFSSIVASTRGGNDLTRSRCYVTNSVIGTSSFGKATGMSADTVIGDPRFVDTAGGDFRVVTVSPAAKLGDPDYLKTALDFTGRPYVFDANGRYVVGAFAQTAGGFSVTATNAVGDGISPTGFICCTEPSNVTFTATDTSRHFLGFNVNGEFRQDDGTGQITLLSEVDVTISVTAVYDTNWYVDDVNGNDTYDGFTWGTAKKTLAAGVALMRSGDTLNVAPGAYRDGTMLQEYTSSPLFTASSWTPTLPSRLVVPAGCSVVSRDGPETTFIVGEADDVTNGEGLGLGPNAIRGVFLGPNTLLSGFTVTGGHTDNTGPENGNTCAGGVAGYDYSSVVENCIISNNVATRGGGMRWGTCRDCRFLGNMASGNSTGMRNVKAYNCLVDNGRGPIVITDCSLYNCTIGAGNRGPNGGTLGTATWILTPANGYVFVNTILAAPATSFEAVYMTNCAYATGVTFDASKLVANENPAVGDVNLDANGRPQKGSVAIDAGDVSLLPESERETDLAGGQRVYNNVMDIGCYEYDARDDFAHALKPNGGVTVSAASPAVEQDGDGVLVRDGELDATWTRATLRGDFAFDCEVTGNGTLRVLLNGETFANLTSAAGAQTLVFSNALLSNDLAFIYEAGAGDAGGAWVGRMVRKFGAILSFR